NRHTTLSLHDALPICSNFVHCASEMNCAGATASFGFPRNRLTQRIVNFENSGPVSKRFESIPIRGRQLPVGDAQKSPHRNIQKRSEEHTSELQSPCNL